MHTNWNKNRKWNYSLLSLHVLWDWSHLCWYVSLLPIYRTATCSWADTDVPNRKYEKFPSLVVSFTDDKKCLQHACHLGFFFICYKNNLYVQSSNVQNFILMFQLWVIFRPSNTGHMFFTKVWSSLCIWRLPRLFAHKYCFRFPIYNF